MNPPTSICEKCGNAFTNLGSYRLCAPCHILTRRTATENRESLGKAASAALESINKARSNVEKKFGLDPKAAAGSLKPQLQLVPPCFEEAVANALQQGAERYGAWNWREHEVAIMTYLGAIRRHLNAFLDGEDEAPDSGISHLGHIGASCAILLDAKKQGTLVDDRPVSTKAQKGDG